MPWTSVDGYTFSENQQGVRVALSGDKVIHEVGNRTGVRFTLLQNLRANKQFGQAKRSRALLKLEIQKQHELFLARSGSFKLGSLVAFC